MFKLFGRKALFAVALATTTLALSAAPAQAIPPGNTLFVTAYYSDATRTQLVGQKWQGCSQPSGSWGITTPYTSLFFPAC